MSKAKFTALLGLVESEEEDISEILEPVALARKAQDMPAAKRGRTAGQAAAPSRGKVVTGRPALGDKNANLQIKPTQTRGKKRNAPDDFDDTNALRDENMLEAQTKPKAARGRPRGTKVARTSDASEKSTVEAPEPVAQPAKRGRKPKTQVATPPVETEIPETQQMQEIQEIPLFEVPETQPIEMLGEDIEDDLVEDLPAYNRMVFSSVQRPSHHIIPLSANRPQQRFIPMSASRIQNRVVPLSASRRPIAVTDSDTNEPSLRWQITDLTRQYESLEAKYQDLREIGVKEAERNFDKLKKQGEERAQTANELIATLKTQLNAQNEMLKEGQRLRQQLEASENRAAELETQVEEKTKSLTTAKAEIKTLSTRLAASRAAEAANAKVPGSAIKGNNGNSRFLANAESAVQMAQMKEDLYADLTGLIVRGVRRDNDDEIYDCLQTGRNGTLHFKLSITPEDKSEDIDEVQFMYLPQLDANRDADLLEVLPDYLTEEISFPRTHAAKFYSRVMKFLTERIE